MNLNFLYRSHAVTRLQLQKNDSIVTDIDFIDLAGSESPKTTKRMNETQQINKSLSAFKTVISAIKHNQTYIPYRDSLLTSVMKSSLSGNAKTLIIINLSPLLEDFKETTDSLRFGTIAEKCELNMN